MIYQPYIHRVAVLSVLLASVVSGPFAWAADAPSGSQLPQEADFQPSDAQPPTTQAVRPTLQLVSLSPRMFDPHLPSIQAALAGDVAMRLPEEVRLMGDDRDGLITATVDVTAFTDDVGVAVDVTACGVVAACISGTFAVGQGSDPAVEDGFQIHQAGGYPITLAPGVEGYLLTKLPDGTSSPVMSVMWEQDQSVYRVQFPAHERQNILFMARSMVLSSPITSQLSTVTDIPANQSVSSRGITVSEAGGESVNGGAEPEVTGSDLAGETVEKTPVVTQPDVAPPDVIPSDGSSPPIATVTESVDVSLAGVENADPTIIQRPDANQERRLPQPDSELPEPLGDVEPVLPEPLPEQLPEQASPELTDNPLDENVPLEDDSQADEGLIVQSVMVRRREGFGAGRLAFRNHEFEAVVADALAAESVIGNQGVGLQITREQLERVAGAVTSMYLNDGYLTSRAGIIDNPVEDGVAWIEVIEGRLADVQIEVIEDDEEEEEVARVSPSAATGEARSDGDDDALMEIGLEDEEEDSRGNDIEGLRTKASYIRVRVMEGAGPPLRITDLEDRLRLLRENPLFARVEADLVPAERPGESILVLRVKENQPLAIGASVDNYAPPSVGSERLGIHASYLNLTGRGDELSANYYRTTTGGLRTADLTYRLPVNSKNGAVQLRAAIDRTEVTLSPFDRLGIQGETERYELSFRQPLTRTHSEEFALSWGFRYQDGQTFVFEDEPTPFRRGPDDDGVSRTSVFTFGQDYLSRDSKGAWSASSQFNFGTGLFDATTNDEPVPDGYFFSWQGQVQRVQRLNPSNLLIMRSDIQLSPDSLLASEQFSMGGGQTLRGYRQNARTGDNGIRLSVEDRITLRRLPSGIPDIQLVPFFDAGAVWNSGSNPNEVSSPSVLVGTGLGLLWEWFLEQEDLSLRVDYAFPLVSLDDDGNNAQDEGVFFRLLYDPD